MTFRNTEFVDLLHTKSFAKTEMVSVVFLDLVSRVFYYINPDTSKVKGKRCYLCRQALLVSCAVDKQERGEITSLQICRTICDVHMANIMFLGKSYYISGLILFHFKVVHYAKII